MILQSWGRVQECSDQLHWSRSKRQQAQLSTHHPLWQGYLSGQKDTANRIEGKRFMHILYMNTHTYANINIPFHFPPQSIIFSITVLIHAFFPQKKPNRASIFLLVGQLQGAIPREIRWWNQCTVHSCTDVCFSLLCLCVLGSWKSMWWLQSNCYRQILFTYY